VVDLRIELSATRLSAGSGQPARDYLFCGSRMAFHTSSTARGIGHVFCCVPVGHLGVEPRASCSQSRRATICTFARTIFCPWTSWESNPVALIASQSADPSASPLFRVDWEVLEPSSTVLQTAAKPSQLPVRPFFVAPSGRSGAPTATKKARCSWGEHRARPTFVAVRLAVMANPVFPRDVSPVSGPPTSRTSPQYRSVDGRSQAMG
jgi:hypothetical protein